MSGRPSGGTQPVSIKRRRENSVPLRGVGFRPSIPQPEVVVLVAAEAVVLVVAVAVVVPPEVAALMESL
jgi:hypothetical protein